MGRPSSFTKEIADQICARLADEDGKVCPKCSEQKGFSSFGKHKNRADGHQVYCFVCMKVLRTEREYDKTRWASTREAESQRNKDYRQANAARISASDRERASLRRVNQPGIVRAFNITRKHGQKRATPAWADMDAINNIYKEAKRLEAQDGIKRHVDHEIPLKSKLVSGLHVHFNLRIMTATDNMKKHNSFQIA